MARTSLSSSEQLKKAFKNTHITIKVCYDFNTYIGFSRSRLSLVYVLFYIFRIVVRKWILARLEFAFFRLAFWLLFGLFTVKFTRFLRKFIDYLETRSVDFCPKMTWPLIDLVVNSRLFSRSRFSVKSLYLHLLACFYPDTSMRKQRRRKLDGWVVRREVDRVG